MSIRLLQHRCFGVSKAFAFGSFWAFRGRVLQQPRTFQAWLGWRIATVSIRLLTGWLTEMSGGYG